MKKLILLSVFTLFSAIPVLQVASAQAPVRSDAAGRHAAGLAMENRGDDKGAFVAFLDAAEGGYPPAQRRLGEIYDSGNKAVKRDFEESIRWYQKAREGGEQIPPPKSPMPTLSGPGVSPQ
jgi:TPR repeat protein